MIETPSLRTRFTVVTVAVLTVLLVGLEAVVYLSLRDRLNDGLEEVLATRVGVVQRLAEETDDVTLLEQELTELGVPAVLTTGTGDVVEVVPAQLGEDAPTPGDDVLSQRVPIGEDASAEVLVSRGSVDRILRRVLLVEIGASVFALALAALLLLRAATIVTRPLRRIADTAGEITAGDRDRRLHPTDPTTELGRMAAAFDTTIDALDEALTEAETAEARSRRFLADAAHQLRTPLAGLRASAEMLVAHPEGPDRARLAANVEREAVRMSRLVDRLLRMARIDRGDDLDLRSTDLLALAATELDRQRALAPGLDFVLHRGAGVPDVTCDRTAVRDAVANLLDNARHFARGRVDIAVEPGVGWVDVVVRDDGPGVPAERVEEVFQRFATTTDGTGLGLPIARGIAEAHGGELRIVDDAFVLTLPIAPLED